MLKRAERRWLPWAPLLLAEGLYARIATARLAPASDPEGQIGDGPAAARVAGLGDSIIAGIGVERQHDGLVGQVSQRIAERAGASVSWLAIGRSGATAQSVLDELLPDALAASPQFVVISVGVNDAVAGTEPALFKERLAAIIDSLAIQREPPSIVFAGIPPLASFPALPWPLSRLLGDRAAGLQAAAVSLAGYRGLKIVAFPPQLPRDAFSRDRFHPGAAGCAVWSGWVADGFARGIEELAEQQGG